MFVHLIHQAVCEYRSHIYMNGGEFTTSIWSRANELFTDSVNFYLTYGACELMIRLIDTYVPHTDSIHARSVQFMQMISRIAFLRHKCEWIAMIVIKSNIGRTGCKK